MGGFFSVRPPVGISLPADANLPVSAFSDDDFRNSPPSGTAGDLRQSTDGSFWWYTGSTWHEVDANTTPNQQTGSIIATLINLTQEDELCRIETAPAVTQWAPANFVSQYPPRAESHAGLHLANAGDMFGVSISQTMADASQHWDGMDLGLTAVIHTLGGDQLLEITIGTYADYTTADFPAPMTTSASNGSDLTVSEDALSFGTAAGGVLFLNLYVNYTGWD